MNKYMNIDEALYQLKQNIKMHEIEGTTSHQNEREKVLLDYITNLQQENERLKKELNCKEYFSSTMPEGTEFVILTKNNYDRQQKDIQLELIDYKSRVEKAVECINEYKELVGMTGNLVYNLLNILQNGSDEE